MESSDWQGLPGEYWGSVEADRMSIPTTNTNQSRDPLPGTEAEQMVLAGSLSRSKSYFLLPNFMPKSQRNTLPPDMYIVTVNSVSETQCHPPAGPFSRTSSTDPRTMTAAWHNRRILPAQSSQHLDLTGLWSPILVIIVWGTRHRTTSSSRPWRRIALRNQVHCFHMSHSSMHGLYIWSLQI